MIKEYQISNFKPFAGAATIPIRPITLIFGANSSGKSSILQSLLMLKQTIENNQDRNTVLLAKGSLVDLGSFREFIHGHDINKSFSFKMTFSSPDDLWEADEEILDVDIDKDKDIKLLERSIHNDLISLKISFHVNTDIVVEQIDFYIGPESKPIITYEIGEKNKDGSFSYKFKGNFDHPYWQSYWKLFDEGNRKNIEILIDYEMTVGSILRKFEKLPPKEKTYVETLLHKLGILPNDAANNVDKNLEVINQREAVTVGKESPKENTDKDSHENAKSDDEIQGFNFERAIESYRNMYEQRILKLEKMLPSHASDNTLKYIASGFSNQWEDYRDVSLIMLTLSNMIKRFLKRIVYLAPLRDYPERYYIYGGNPVQNVGASGRMVPDILFSDHEALTKVNEAIMRFTGKDYILKVSKLSDEQFVTSEIFTLQMVDMKTGVSANIRDTGFGFSQVLPIIVQTMMSREKTLLIEQPELHLHPALQAELGDLFINAALGEQKNTFIIETHSEHLILRLLRRIRETSEGSLPQGCTPITPDQISVLYVQPGKDGAQITNLSVTDGGDFECKWPDGFFTEREKELF